MSRMGTSSNPFLSQGRLTTGSFASSDASTVNGAVTKTFILTGILIIAAVFSWTTVMANTAMATTFMWGGFIGGIIAAMVAFFKPSLAPIAAPIYAVCEGLALGAISLFYAMMTTEAGVDPLSNPDTGIIFNAVFGTLACLFSMLALYKTGIVKPTQRFKSILSTAMGAIFLLYMVNMGLHFFAGSSVPYLHTGHPVGIIISLVVIGVAAFSLIVDFERFEIAERAGAPKYMEWALGLGLLVTLVWLYLEILRLLAVLSSND